ncbi:MAG: hypothetical protein RR482_00705 [Clostridia bacterium]
MEKTCGMRRWVAAGLMMIFLSAWGCAQATAPAGWLDTLQETERKTLIELAISMGEKTSEDALYAIWSELMDQGDTQSMTGWLTDDVYTHPNGFQLQVPEGWSILENEGDTTVTVMADADETGFSMRIGVTSLPADAEDRTGWDAARWDASLATLHADYQRISFDTLPYQDTQACELVFGYKDAMGRAVVQHHFYFHADTGYLICMDARAEQAEEEAPLQIYDTFLNHFAVGV